MPVEICIKKTAGNFHLNVKFQGQSRRIGILGASGCGKSMTLKCIAGIEKPEEGLIRIDGRTFFDSAGHKNLKPQERNIGFLFQNYALFPTMTVAQNIEAGLKGTKAEKRNRVKEMIERFQLTGFEQHLPSQLSGGQQQRVALARIMAYEPDVLLLDEPFSASDLYLRDQLQRELTEMLEDYQGTAILVSHSRDEIYRFSQELLVMDQGQGVIYNKTKDIFANPVYEKAARLTGCKNFSSIRKIDQHTIAAVDWGIRLRLNHPVSEDVTCVGYRAHDFVPIWGERPVNGLRMRLAEIAELPFETNYYLFPEKEGENEKVICWFVQRECLEEIQKQGVPDYLEIREEKLLFLKS